MKDFDLTRLADFKLLWKLREEHPPPPLTPNQRAAALEYLDKIDAEPNTDTRYRFELFAMRCGIYGADFALHNITELQPLYQLGAKLFDAEIQETLQRCGMSPREVQRLVRTGRLPDLAPSWRSEERAHARSNRGWF
jgi:hypothetical protein